jgi:nicastrin
MKMMKRKTLVLRLAFLCVVVCVGLVAPTADGIAIQDAMYPELSSAHPCVTLLHRTGAVGCHTSQAGSVGLLRRVRSEEDVAWMQEEYGAGGSPDHKVALVLRFDLFTLALVQQMQTLFRDNLAGVIVVAGGNEKHSMSPWSPDLRSPNTYNYKNVSQSNDLHSAFAWNPDGDGMLLQRFDFAVVSVSDAAEAADVSARADENEENVRAGDKFMPHAVEFRYSMDAIAAAETRGAQNSLACIVAGTCMPVGGHSVWGKMGTLTPSTPTVVLTTAMDSVAMFHGSAVGAEAEMSGLAVLLAAADALSTVSDIRSLPKTLVFAVFAGESWDNIGSRKFVEELQTFTCDKPDAKNPAGACAEPYKESLAFSNLTLGKIDSLIELRQVLLGDNLYLHTQASASGGGNKNKNTVNDDLLELGAAMNVSVAVSDVDTGGELPPSSTRSFLDARADLGNHVVITDHAGSFKNKYYHARSDVPRQNFNNERDRLCSVATLTARAAYKQAGGTNQTVLGGLAVDCATVCLLYECLTTDMACPLVQMYGGAYSNSPPTHYTGVYQLLLSSYIGGTPRFIKSWLLNAAINSTHTEDPDVFSGPYESYYHDAVDPAFVFDYQARVWSVNETRAQHTALWTESNWPARQQTVLFQRIPSSTVVVTGVLGALVVLLSLVATTVGETRCKYYFKALQP